MKQSNYIIKSGDDATVWLTKRYERYTLVAKSRGKVVSKVNRRIHRSSRYSSIIRRGKSNEETV